MTDKTYDTLKMAALLIIPVGTFLETLFQIWGVPGAEQIQQTFIALDVLAGAIVSVAKMRYDKAAK